jgi:hypothetical protein
MATISRSTIIGVTVSLMFAGIAFTGFIQPKPVTWLGILALLAAFSFLLIGIQISRTKKQSDKVIATPISMLQGIPWLLSVYLHFVAGWWGLISLFWEFSVARLAFSVLAIIGGAMIILNLLNLSDAMEKKLNSPLPEK